MIFRNCSPSSSSDFQVVPQKKSEGVRLLLHLARGVSKGVLQRRRPNTDPRATWTQRSKEATSFLDWPFLLRPATSRRSTGPREQWQCCWAPPPRDAGAGGGDWAADHHQGGEDSVGDHQQVLRGAHHGNRQALHLSYLGPSFTCCSPLDSPMSTTSLPAISLSTISLSTSYMSSTSPIILELRPRLVGVKPWYRELLTPLFWNLWKVKSTYDMKNLHWRCSWCFHYREDDLNVYMKCPTTVLETGFNGCLDCCLNRIYSTSKKTWQIVCANILPKSLVVCHDMCSLVPICIWKWHPYQTGNLYLAFVKIFPNNKHSKDRGRVICDNLV